MTSLCEGSKNNLASFEKSNVFWTWIASAFPLICGRGGPHLMVTSVPLAEAACKLIAKLCRHDGSLSETENNGNVTKLVKKGV